MTSAHPTRSAFHRGAAALAAAPNASPQPIDRHGGDSKSIKLIGIPFPEMIGALDAGRVDAAIPGLALKFAGAIHKAAIWANAHPKESAVMLTKFTKRDPKVAATMSRAAYATSLDPAELQPVLDNGVRYGVLPRPMDANELIWKPPSK